MGHLIGALKKTDGRLRECLTTLVDVQSRSYKKNFSTKRQKSQGNKDYRSKRKV